MMISCSLLWLMGDFKEGIALLSMFGLLRNRKNLETPTALQPQFLLEILVLSPITKIEHLQACRGVFVNRLETAVPGAARCSGPVVTPQVSSETIVLPGHLQDPHSCSLFPSHCSSIQNLCKLRTDCAPQWLCCRLHPSHVRCHSTGPSTFQFPDIRLIKNVSSHENHQREITLPIFLLSFTLQLFSKAWKEIFFAG